MKVKTKKEYTKRRHLRVRRKVAGTSERPRMCVNVSNANISVQFIDDDAGKTLMSASSLSKDMQQFSGKPKVEVAKAVGKQAGELAKKQGIEKVVFDRGGFTYGGRVAALADAAREAGLVF